MRKQLLIAAVTLIPAMSFAKIADFSDMIAENVKAQNELHETVRHNVDDAREVAAGQGARQRIVVIEKSGTSFNAPTRKDMLVFKKEKTDYRASESKSFERLASEIHSLDQ
ncbi:MAG: hypothetical protein ACKOX6_08275 [Bdellovibrio sp.]